MTTTSEKIKWRLGELTSSNVRLEYKGDKNQVYFSVCHPNLIEALEIACEKFSNCRCNIPQMGAHSQALIQCSNCEALDSIAEKLGVNAENK